MAQIVNDGVPKPQQKASATLYFGQLIKPKEPNENFII